MALIRSSNWFEKWPALSEASMFVARFLQQTAFKSLIMFTYCVCLSLCLLTGVRAASVTSTTCTANNASGAATSGILLNATIGPNSANWSMCIIQDAKVGFLLNQITLTPPANDGGIKTKILGQASLSQIVLTLAGKSPNAVIGQGLGSAISWSALPNDCVNPAIGTLPLGLCVQIVPRGYAWRGYKGLVQGESLVVSTSGLLSGDVYNQKWVFDEDGSVHPSLGIGTQTVSGSLDRLASALWRLSFQIDNGSTTIKTNNIEQIDYQSCPSPFINCSTTRTQAVTSITSGTQSIFNPDTQRFWRIRSAKQNNSNGWPISYEILSHQTALDRQSYSFDIAFSDLAASSCVIRNLGSDGCSILHLITSEGQSIANPVVWLVTTSHQISSTQSFYSQGFHLRTRDLTQTSPLL